MSSILMEIGGLLVVVGIVKLVYTYLRNHRKKP